jgi:chitodextrinase
MVSGLTASTTYNFYIVATDAAGNTSVASNTANVTTLTPADTSSPTTVTLSASGITTSSTNLSWTAATDNIGVAGYNVYQNGILKTTTSATALTVSGLTASTAYNFYIVATDAAGNVSVASNTANMTTLTPADTSSPTAVTLSVSGITTSSIDLSWTAATDNIGVSNYTIYQNGILKTTTSATALTVSGLTASTAYSFYIVAKDAAGNLSVASNTANATTLVNPINTTLDKFNITYCASSGINTDKEFINKVKIGAIDNTSGNNKGYGNFLSISTDLAIGTSNTIVITPTWTRSTLSEAYSLWIDLNQDGDFEDNGELIFSKPKTKAKFVSESFLIPTTASIGTTRMRVSMKNNSIPKSCEIFSYGEVEDYTVNITGSTAKPESNNEETNLSATENSSKDTKSSFKLYPNPVKGDLLNVSNTENYSTFKIFNLLGQVLEKNLIENNTINISSLNAGVYLIEFTNDSSRITRQFIKQ